MNSQLLSLRCLSDDTRKALILEDEMEERFQQTLRQSQETLKMWEKESKEFELMGRKLLHYFQEIAPFENLILPEEAAQEDKENMPLVSKAAMSFGAQTSFSYHTDSSVLSGHQDSQNFSTLTPNTTQHQSSISICSDIKNNQDSQNFSTVTPNTTQHQSIRSDIQTTRTLNNTSITSLSRNESPLLSSKTLPFDNLISPSVMESPASHMHSDTTNDTSVFDNLTTPSVLDTPDSDHKRNIRDEQKNISTNRNKPVQLKNLDIVESSGSGDNDTSNVQLVGYDITTMQKESLVSHDDTVGNLFKPAVGNSDKPSEFSSYLNDSSSVTYTTAESPMEKRRLVDYDVTKAKLVDYDRTKTRIISANTPDSNSGLVDYDLTKTRISSDNNTPNNNGLVDYDMTKTHVLSENTSSSSNNGLVEYTESTFSKSLLNYHSSVPGGALVDYDSTIAGDRTLVSSFLTTDESKNVLPVHNSIASDGTPSAILDTPFPSKASSLMMKSQNEDISSLKRSLASSIDELSEFENPNDTGINRIDLQSVYENHLDDELDYVNHNDTGCRKNTGGDRYNLRNRTKKIVVGMSKKLTKQISSPVENAASSSLSPSSSVVEIGSISPSPLKVEKKPLVTPDQKVLKFSRDSIDFNVHSMKEQSVQMMSEGGTDSLSTTSSCSVSPRKRGSVPDREQQQSPPTKKSVPNQNNESKSVTPENHDVSSNSQRNNFNFNPSTVESAHDDLSPPKRLKMQNDELAACATKGNPRETIVFCASPAALKKNKTKTPAKKLTAATKKRKRKRQCLAMPKGYKNPGNSKYTFQSYSKVRAYQNSPSNRALRQLQHTTTTTLLSSAKKIKAKQNINKALKKSNFNNSTSASTRTTRRGILKSQETAVVDPVSLFAQNATMTSSPPVNLASGGTPNCTVAECSACTAELDSPPHPLPDLEGATGSTPLTKILCKNCICVLNAREKTFLNVTSNRKEQTLLTTLLFNQTQNKRAVLNSTLPSPDADLAEPSGTSAADHSSSETAAPLSKAQTRQRGKAKSTNQSQATTTATTTTRTLRKRKAVNGRDTTKTSSAVVTLDNDKDSSSNREKGETAMDPSTKRSKKPTNNNKRTKKEKNVEESVNSVMESTKVSSFSATKNQPKKTTNRNKKKLAITVKAVVPSPQNTKPPPPNKRGQKQNKPAKSPPNKPAQTPPTKPKGGRNNRKNGSLVDETSSNHRVFENEATKKSKRGNTCSTSKPSTAATGKQRRTVTKKTCAVSPTSPSSSKKPRADLAKPNGRKSILNLQFQQLSVLKEVNEEEQSAVTNCTVKLSVVNDKSSRNSSSNNNKSTATSSKETRRPGLRKRKVEGVAKNDESATHHSVVAEEKSVAESVEEDEGSLHQESTIQESNPKTTKPTRRKRSYYKGASQKRKTNARAAQKNSQQRQQQLNSKTATIKNNKIDKQKATLSTSTARRSTWKNDEEKSLVETQSSSTITHPSERPQEQSVTSTSSESDDKEVVLNLPNDYRDFNSKDRRRARKATKKTNDSGIAPEQHKENSAAGAEHDSTSDVSDMNATVIRNAERTPKNRALRPLKIRANAIRSNVVHFTNENAQSALPQPFAAQSKKSSSVFQKPLQPATTTKKQANGDGKQAKLIIGARNSTGLDGTQSSINSTTMMNRSRKLFKVKSNSVRTPDSGDKDIPMNSTVLDHHRQSLSSGIRSGNSIPDVSAIQNASRAANTRYGSFKQSQQNLSLGCPASITHLANRIQAKK